MCALRNAFLVIYVLMPFSPILDGYFTTGFIRFTIISCTSIPSTVRDADTYVFEHHGVVLFAADARGYFIPEKRLSYR